MSPSLNPSRLWLGLLVAAAVLTLSALQTPARKMSEQERIAPKSQVDAYAAQVPKTVIELQPFRKTHTIKIKAAGDKTGTATLINLNPTINTWYLLQLIWPAGTPGLTYHLENAKPHSQRLRLDKRHPHGLIIAEGTRTYTCDLWAATSPHSLDAAKRSRLPYTPLCKGRLYLRNPIKGHRTHKEMATDFLRDKIWGGERLVGFVRDVFYKDAYLDKAESRPAKAGLSQKKAAHTPRPALIDPKYAGHVVVPANLGINIQHPAKQGVALGRWYAAQDNPGIYVSLIQPNVIAPEILQSHPTLLNPSDRVEAKALAYVIAFDLDQFDLGFTLGTNHPRVGWSQRVLNKVKDQTLPGPDGIGNLAPLVATGLINPQRASRTVATFTAGFKRSHGAFKYGALATKNHGSHYGFIENGVVLSKLQPGLATLFIRDDGLIHMKTWTKSDNAQLARIKHARQNGVPIIEFDTSTQTSMPGPLVSRWGHGNWSGSANKKLRTLRAGVCLQENQAGRFLIYGYFSSVTPSAMARVFHAYGCRYAMHLDMNALEHTYLAVYKRQGSKVAIQHLIQGMNVLDKSEAKQYIPRFLGYADNRDFFYIMRREPRKATS